MLKLSFVLSKPLAHLNQHLEGCLERGIDVQIVGETNLASITMASEHATHDGVLRQTKTHHLSSPGLPPSYLQLCL